MHIVEFATIICHYYKLITMYNFRNKNYGCPQLNKLTVCSLEHVRSLQKASQWRSRTFVGRAGSASIGGSLPHHCIMSQMVQRCTLSGFLLVPSADVDVATVDPKYETVGGRIGGWQLAIGVGGAIPTRGPRQRTEPGTRGADLADLLEPGGTERASRTPCP
jgi:hypothetical protein